MSDKKNVKTEDVEIIENSQKESTTEDNSELKNAIEQLKLLSNDELIEIVVKQQQAYIENQSKLNELTSLLKRVQADFDNYRKRNTENISKIRQDAAIDVIERFLPTLDIIDQAISMIKDEGVLGGIIMMRKQLMEVFASYGVSEIEALGEDFNPNLHEAVMSEENPDMTGKVLEILRRGYKMGDKVLRYTAVKVAN